MGLQITVNIFSILSSNTCKLVKVTPEVVADSNTTWQKNHFMEADSGIQQLQELMDKLLEGSSSRDSIRNMMLKHEKIFKEQVLELHRLYRIQKILMAQQEKEIILQRHVNIKTSKMISDARSEFWSTISNSQGSLSSNMTERPTSVQSTCEFNIELGSTIPSSRSLNINFAESYRTQKGMNLEDASIHGCSSTNFMVNLDKSHLVIKRSPNDLEEVEDSDLELTLSLCGSSSRKKSSNITSISNSEQGKEELTSTQTWQSTSTSHTNPLQEQETPTMSVDSEGLQKPPWLLQSFSLKRT